MALGYGAIVPETLLILCLGVSFLGAALSGLIVAFAFRRKRRRCIWYNREVVQHGELVEFILNTFGVPMAIVTDEQGYLYDVLPSKVKLL